MLDKFKKFFKEQKEVEMIKEDTQADMSVVDINEQLAAANEALASNAVAMEKLNEQLAELMSKFEAAQAALAAVEAEKSNMLAEAAAKKLADRKAKVEMAIGENDKAAALLAATENMADEQFEAVVSALTGSMEAEAKSEMFKEVGVSAQAKVDVDEKPTHFNTFIKK